MSLYDRLMESDTQSKQLRKHLSRPMHFTRNTAQSVLSHPGASAEHKAAAQKFLDGGGLSPLQKRIRAAKRRREKKSGTGRMCWGKPC